MQNRRNYYRVLQVQPDAAPEIIKASYRILMQKLRAHPDLGGDEWNAALINEAYAVLADPVRRARYDASQAPAKGPLGAGARTADKTSVRGDEAHAPPTAPAEERPRPVRRAVLPACVFCGSGNPPGKYPHGEESCRRCGAPLRPAGTTRRSERERLLRRLKHEDEIRFQVDPGDPAVYRATVVDLSPTGLRFVSHHPLEPGMLVKLDGLVLCAVAAVTYSLMSSPLGEYATGVEFVTLKTRRARGTFLSSKA